ASKSRRSKVIRWQLTRKANASRPRDVQLASAHTHVSINLVRVAVLVLAVACGDNTKEPDYLGYPWDDRRVLCSQPIDDYQRPLDWSVLERRMDFAAQQEWVLILHAHVPTQTIALDTLDRVLATAESRGLEFFTFRELVPGDRRAGLALAFDDNSPDQWMIA